MKLIDYLSSEDGTERMVSECLKFVDESDGIIAFGAGIGGEALYHLLKDNHLDSKLLGWSDNNELKWGRSYQSQKLMVIPPNELAEKYGSDLHIIVCSSAFDKIQVELCDFGVKSENIRLFNFAFMDLKYTDKSFIYDHIADFDRSFQSLEDEKSRRIYCCLLNYKITKDEKYLLELQNFVDDEKNQYFDNSLYEFLEKDVLLDVGAYTGDTLKSYSEHFVNCSGYYGMEADAYIFNKLHEYVIKQNMSDKCKIFNYAAWDTRTTLYFDENPGTSTITDVGGNAVKAITIDDLLLDEDPVTIVKMDIEGAEANALVGARKLIKEDKPILAICVYHKRDDYYHLLDIIKDICPNEYSFYFRQYRYTPTETVCYAIPKNRKIKT